MFSRDDWDRVAARFAAWWAGEGPIFTVAARRKGSPPPVDFSTVAPDEKWFNPQSRLARVEDEVANTYYGGDAYARVFVNFGPGIVAGFLGSPVHASETTVWFEKCVDSWAGREFAFDPANPWWQRTVRMTEALCEAARGRWCVTMTDLGGIHDILASLRGTQELLFDFADAPEEIERVADQVAAAWLRCYDELQKIISRHQQGSAAWDGSWSPGRMYCPQEDVSAMLSPEDFRRHSVPRLRQICAALDHTVYHLDGPDAIRHLDALLEIPELDAIQWIQGDGKGPVRDWLPLLKRIQDGGKRVQCFAGPADVERLLRGLRPEGLYIGCTARDEEEARKVERMAGKMMPGRT